MSIRDIIIVLIVFCSSQTWAQNQDVVDAITSLHSYAQSEELRNSDAGIGDLSVRLYGQEINQSLNAQQVTSIFGDVIHDEDVFKNTEKNEIAVKKLSIITKFLIAGRAREIHKLINRAIGKLRLNVDLKDYEIYISPSPYPEASILKSEYIETNKPTEIYISVGLLALAKNEDQFASVLAHELVHNYPKLLKALETEDGFTHIRQQLENSAELNTSQREELRADLGALFLLEKAGYNPWALYNFFHRLAEYRLYLIGWALKPFVDSDSNMSVFEDHPTTEVRMGAVRDALLLRQHQKNLKKNIESFNTESSLFGPLSLKRVKMYSWYFSKPMRHMFSTLTGYLVINFVLSAVSSDQGLTQELINYHASLIHNNTEAPYSKDLILILKNIKDLSQSLSHSLVNASTIALSGLLKVGLAISVYSFIKVTFVKKDKSDVSLALKRMKQNRRRIFLELLKPNNTSSWEKLIYLSVEQLRLIDAPTTFDRMYLEDQRLKPRIGLNTNVLLYALKNYKTHNKESVDALMQQLNTLPSFSFSNKSLIIEISKVFEKLNTQGGDPSKYRELYHHMQSSLELASLIKQKEPSALEIFSAINNAAKLNLYGLAQELLIKHYKSLFEHILRSQVGDFELIKKFVDLHTLMGRNVVTHYVNKFSQKSFVKHVYKNIRQNYSSNTLQNIFGDIYFLESFDYFQGLKFMLYSNEQYKLLKLSFKKRLLQKILRERVQSVVELDTVVQNEILKNNKPPRLLSEILYKFIINNQHLIQSHADIDILLSRVYFWPTFSNPDSHGRIDVDLVDKLSIEAYKLPNLLKFEPKQAEALQKIILQKKNELGESISTIEEKLNTFILFSKRGVTGLTDDLAKEIFKNGNSQQVKKILELNQKGYVWAPFFRYKLFTKSLESFGPYLQLINFDLAPHSSKEFSFVGRKTYGYLPEISSSLDSLHSARQAFTKWMQIFSFDKQNQTLFAYRIHLLKLVIENVQKVFPDRGLEYVYYVGTSATDSYKSLRSLISYLWVSY